MRRHIALAFVAFGIWVLTVLGLSFNVQAAGQGFDGTWTVKHECKKAPDGALPFAYNYIANVSAGSMDGQYTVPGVNGGTFHIHGPINPDGTGNLTMNGVTGQTEYNVGHLSPGVPFSYRIRAKFTTSGGSGRRTDGKRHCDFTFVKR
jgi:hypothetical protein